MTKELLAEAAEPYQTTALTPAASSSAAEQRVWILRLHHRVTLREAHAVVDVDWEAGVARTSCGLGLRPHEITDVPAGGGMPCVACIAATPLPQRAALAIADEQLQERHG